MTYWYLFTGEFNQENVIEKRVEILKLSSLNLTGSASRAIPSELIEFDCEHMML